VQSTSQTSSVTLRRLPPAGVKPSLLFSLCSLLPILLSLHPSSLHQPNLEQALKPKNNHKHNAAAPTDPSKKTQVRTSSPNNSNMQVPHTTQQKSHR
jgi:hypothetical protein